MTKKVIIIDDSLTQLSITRSAFSKNSWEVYTATNVKRAYDMIFEVAPDLVITDAIMPVVGGFQLVKMIRENETISKIPVIVYSVLGKSHAKFYIKEKTSEYFLRKSDDITQLLELAMHAVENFPLSEEYKAKIKLLNIEKNKLDKIEEPIEKVEEPIFEVDPFLNFKKIRDYTASDEKLFLQLFSNLYSALKYDLFVIDTYSFDKDERCVFFDIKNILLSPILKNNILRKYKTSESVLLKKYSPNLKTVVSLDEFKSKVEFNIFYKENINVAFYSKEELKWHDKLEIEKVRLEIENFIKSRYIAKKSKIRTRKSFYNQIERLPSKSDVKTYLGIIEITNLSDFSNNLSEEDFDIVNTKISQKIMTYIEKNETLTKNYEDEYGIVIFAKDDNHAEYRLNCISESLNSILYYDINLEAYIGASCCNLESNLNIYEAQKLAREALEKTSKQENVVINHAGK